ncbi:hypothetical protein BBK36DRAFT_1163320 [Trichoderma citrinoviride]|uniref:Uncharacterized protein n=1 Tax=Trichoderma citrinoviride TaxID=58853 RepID=A0A2T4AYY6_9HYPO|nr:hypothetical protein BBK36DRAFT_1163320 [Trichoderma citrinoviride]PTB62286.1 hypothetical protein BBK36DRAFT_1163320 [Trichoderma citrinoviride]
MSGPSIMQGTNSSNGQQAAQQASSQAQGSENNNNNTSTASSQQALPPTQRPSDAEVIRQLRTVPSPLERYAGRYTISYWPKVDFEFTIELIVVGWTLRGRFDLGPITGVLELDEVPTPYPDGSTDSVLIRWRGYEPETQVFHGGYNNDGWIAFLGNGEIEGFVSFDKIHFGGSRVSDAGTTGIDKTNLWDDWVYYEENARLSRQSLAY